jgi:predicted nuclease of predicted toxin-antitoxin system
LIRILLDEHVSPSLVGKLGDKGVFAAAATHVGLSGEPDAKIWNYAFENDFVVVTGNARDFIRLLNVEVHPGLKSTNRKLSGFDGGIGPGKSTSPQEIKH